jgi:hypothetical protein
MKDKYSWEGTRLGGSATLNPVIPEGAGNLERVRLGESHWAEAGAELASQPAGGSSQPAPSQLPAIPPANSNSNDNALKKRRQQLATTTYTTMGLLRADPSMSMSVKRVAFLRPNNISPATRPTGDAPREPQMQRRNNY